MHALNCVCSSGGSVRRAQNLHAASNFQNGTTFGAPLFSPRLPSPDLRLGNLAILSKTCVFLPSLAGVRSLGKGLWLSVRRGRSVDRMPSQMIKIAKRLSTIGVPILSE